MKFPFTRLLTRRDPANQWGLRQGPSPEDIARRAYFGYQRRGMTPGHDVDDWLRAETELAVERRIIEAC